MTTRDREDSSSQDQDPGNKVTEASMSDGTMRLGKDDPARGSMTGAFEENVQDLGRGENPLVQGAEDTEREDDEQDPHEEQDGHADVFSPNRTDEPD